jgi:hypothetical protein
MFWKILIIVSLLLSSWAAWAAWQNTMTIGKIMDMVNDIVSATMKKDGE